MMLGGKTIKLFTKLGWIYCNPDARRTTENSVDVTLGRHVWRLRDDVRVIDPRENAINYFEYFMMDKFETFKMQPSRMYLMHTEEFVGSKVPWIVPQIRTRSTFARWTGECGRSALLGEGNFHSRWVLEAHCADSIPLLVKPGWRVGQIFFLMCAGGGMYNRQYNTQREEWTPEVMLPKQMD